MKNLKDKKGFTIIELIVVIAILGILVLLAGPRLLGYVEKAELARIQHDVKVMENKMAEVLTTDDEFNKWENNNKDFNQLIKENRLFEKEGVAKKIESIDKTYKVIPEKYKDKINTKLKGTFYANSGGKVYYEHEKPLSEIPDEPEKEPGIPDEPGKNPGYSDEEIEELIEKGYIPIATAEELNNARNTITETYGKGTKWENKYEGGLDKKYIQVANVDLSGYSEGKGWVPIGDENSKFTGSFNGNGYKITRLTIDRPDTNYIGLFGYIQEATIENVALEDVNIKGKEYTGGLVGEADNSSIKDSYATGEVSGKNYTGGLVGYAYDSTIISNSYATGPVTNTGVWTGGLVGRAYRSSISNSYATGTVSGGTGNDTGGLVGEADNSSIKDSYATGEVTGSDWTGGLVGGANNSTTISNSYATGEVTGSGWIGGLVGGADSSTTISNSYATGTVSGTGNNTGGLVGKAKDSTIKDSYARGTVTSTGYWTGGLVGYAGTSTITNSYATGPVNDTGGLVGGAYSSSITKSYWDTETTGQTKSAGGEGKTTDDLKKQITYDGWDFENTWEIEEGQSYPTLKNIAN